MSDPDARQPRLPAQAWRRQAGLWTALIALSGVAVVMLRWIGAPAALLLGPLLVAIVFGVRGAEMRPASRVRTTAQAVIGVVLGVALAGAYTPAFALYMPVFLSLGAASMAIAGALGWVVARRRWITGSTAIWGLAPGASAAMVALAERHGGDVRIVGLMQYFRILMVAAAALGMAHLLAPGATPHHGSTPWLVFGGPYSLIALAGLVGLGLAVDRWTSVPAGALLVPSLAASALQATGWVHIVTPAALTAIAYAVVGWNIGLGFTRRSLVQSVRILPRLLGLLAAFLALCALLAVPLVVLLHVDPLTAYLSTSPGGVDSMLIIAASTPVDLPFILSAQTARFLLVVAFGPALVRLLIRRLDPQRPGPEVI